MYRIFRSALTALALVLIGSLWPGGELGAETRYRALVLDDGSLRVGSRTVRLHGIYIPPTNRVCRDFQRPVVCGSRAVLALDRRVDRFVVCDYLGRSRDRSYQAYCSITDKSDSLGPRVDLGAWMLYRGWAVALPGAPFAYHTLERIAQHHRRGIWGFQADSIRSR